MSGEITILLRRWNEGDRDAYQQLIPHVYPHLREVAGGYLGRERTGHTLQPTALVHELYLRLLRQQKAEWADRTHFYTFAAKMMRLILADHARSANALKRGGTADRVDFTGELRGGLPWNDPHSESFLDLNRGLNELEAVDPRRVRLVELRYFLGCTVAEAAQLLEISIATAERDLVLVRSWLYARLMPED